MPRNTLAITAIAAAATAGLMALAQPAGPATGKSDAQPPPAAAKPPVLAIAGGPFACDLGQKTCRATFQVTSDKRCTLAQTEAIFVDRSGAAITGKLTASSEALVPAVPRPLLVRMENVQGVSLGSLPVAGTVVFRCDGEPKAFATQISAAKPAWPFLAAIIIPLALAAAAVLPALVTAFSYASRTMATPEWSATPLSKVAVGNGLLSAILTGALFTTSVFAEKDSYFILSALYTALIGLSPFVHMLTRVPTSVDPPAFQGALWSFVLASFFTVWGNAGQIMLFWCVLLELWSTGKVPELLMNIFHGVSAVTLLLLLAFSMVVLLRNCEKPPDQEREAAPTPAWKWL